MPKFQVPPGFALPEGTLEGEDFQVVVTANVQDGQIEVKEIEGITIEGYEEPEDEEEDDEMMEEEETEESQGMSAGDRFNKKFRGKVAAY